MLKREENQLKQDSEKKNVSETAIREKKILVKTVIRKSRSERMLKTMKKTNAPREGRGVPLQRQNPKNF